MDKRSQTEAHAVLRGRSAPPFRAPQDEQNSMRPMELMDLSLILHASPMGTTIQSPTPSLTMQKKLRPFSILLLMAILCVSHADDGWRNSLRPKGTPQPLELKGREIVMDGEATAQFDVHYGSASPKTGDENNLVLWLAVMVLSGSAVVALIPKKKKQ